MTNPPEAYEPRRFRTTAPFYARYRLGYPDSSIERTIALTGLSPGDPVMDLGSGPGLLAVPFARRGLKVTAVDPEPDMVEAAREAAREAGVALDVRRGSSFELPADIGPFKLVTMGRSFHWMDRPETLKLLDRLVVPGGAVVLFGDDHPRTAENAWREAGRDVAIKYGRNESPHLVAAQRPDYRSHAAVLFDFGLLPSEGRRANSSAAS